VELLSGDVRRRRWSWETKERIVSETLEPGVTVTEVARRHGVDRSLVYRWRREFGVERRTSGSRFLPVTVEADASGGATAASASGRDGSETIEIVLPDGVCIRVGASVRHEALSRVLRALGR
jgi:transposase